MCSTTRGVDFDPENVAPGAGSAGDYYLLAIAVDEYEDDRFRKLNNAVLDAASVVELLLKKYDFYQPTDNVKVLANRETLFGQPIKVYDSLRTKCLYNEDATLSNINKHLIALSKKLTANDNLLIYFAGHGVIHFDESYVIPFDANKDESQFQSWFPLRNIALFFDNYSTRQVLRHLLLVIDACYAGGAAFGMQSTISGNFSRRVLTSATANQTASDGKKGKGSPFARAFLRFLEKSLLTINKNQLALFLENFKEQADQEILYELLPSKQNGTGEFRFRLRNKEKHDLANLAKCLISHLNFNLQRDNLSKQLYSGQADDLVLLATQGYSYEVQRFLTRVLLQEIRDMGFNFSDNFLPIPIQLQRPYFGNTYEFWTALAKAVDNYHPDKEPRSSVLNWLDDNLKYTTQQIAPPPVIFWLDYEVGNSELAEELLVFLAEFSRIFANKRQLLASENQRFGKLFFVTADKRDLMQEATDALGLNHQNFTQKIGNDPQIIVTDPVELFAIGDLIKWLANSKQEVKIPKIRQLKHHYFFPDNNRRKCYRLLPFVEKLTDYCEFNPDEIDELKQYLIDFKTAIV